MKVYLAGKVSKHGWREDILGWSPDGRTVNIDCEDYEWPILLFKSSAAKLYYVGQYFKNCDHGCAHYPSSHGWPAGQPCCDEGSTHDVWTRDMAVIRKADLVFAWIDSLDCYGTIAEIGYAHGKQKKIVIAGPEFYKDLWFVYQFVGGVAFNWHTAAEAFAATIRGHRAFQPVMWLPEWRTISRNDQWK